jgi:hypothetical protein
MALAKRDFGEISFRDGTEKIYFGETIGGRGCETKDGSNRNN